VIPQSPAPVRGPLQGVVVVDDNDAVSGQVNVELEAVRAQ
jgi:hypothetical protein